MLCPNWKIVHAKGRYHTIIQTIGAIKTFIKSRESIVDKLPHIQEAVSNAAITETKESNKLDKSKEPRIN